MKFTFFFVPTTKSGLPFSNICQNNYKNKINNISNHYKH